MRDIPTNLKTFAQKANETTGIYGTHRMVLSAPDMWNKTDHPHVLPLHIYRSFTDEILDLADQYDLDVITNEESNHTQGRYIVFGVPP